VITMLALKPAIGIYFLRILLQPWQKRIVYAAVALSTAFNVAYFFIICFQCGVTHNSYEIFEKFVASKCISAPKILGVAYTHAVITALTDWTFAIMPLAMIKQSKLRTREKFIVGFIILMAAM
jgi:hypothetical protein